VYQAVGFLADLLGYWQMKPDEPGQHQITKLLDNLAAAAAGEPVPHADLLPFGWRRDTAVDEAKAQQTEVDANHKAFLADLDRLEPNYTGKFALYRNAQCIAVMDTIHDAVTAGHLTGGLPFSVQEITRRVERV
jgi:hypothetical protein